MIQLRYVKRGRIVKWEGCIDVDKRVEVLQFREAILDPLTFVAGNSISNWTEWKDVPIVDEVKK